MAITLPPPDSCALVSLSADRLGCAVYRELGGSRAVQPLRATADKY